MAEAQNGKDLGVDWRLVGQVSDALSLDRRRLLWRHLLGGVLGRVLRGNEDDGRSVRGQTAQAQAAHG